MWMRNNSPCRSSYSCINSHHLHGEEASTMLFSATTYKYDTPFCAFKDLKWHRVMPYSNGVMIHRRKEKAAIWNTSIVYIKLEHSAVDHGGVMETKPRKLRRRQLCARHSQAIKLSPHLYNVTQDTITSARALHALVTTTVGQQGLHSPNKQHIYTCRNTQRSNCKAILLFSKRPFVPLQRPSTLNPTIIKAHTSLNLPKRGRHRQ